jgi:hypothetical protein
MGRLLLLTLVCQMFAASLPLTCDAQRIGLTSIPGLTQDIYYALSGVWDERTEKETYTSGLQAGFSWGTAKYGSDSVLIDLASETPYVQQYTSRVEVVSIRRLSETRFRLDCRGIKGPMKSGYLDLTLVTGILRIDEHSMPPDPLRSSAFSMSTVRGLRRLSGPSAESARTEK